MTPKPKISKAKADYRSTSSKRTRCGTCSMYLRGGGCTLVDGKINVNAVCKYWEAK